MILYIASPYSHPDRKVEQWRYEMVQEEVARLHGPDVYPYSPIVYTHVMAQRYDLPTEADYWKNHNEAFLRQSHKLIVLMLEDWDKSVGVRAEIAFAESLGIPVVYLVPGQALEVAA
jgi:hypothetical protein